MATEGQIINCTWNDGIFQKLIRFGNMIHYGMFGYTHTIVVAKIEGPDALLYEATEKGIIKSWYSIEWINNKIESGELAIGTIKGMTNVEEVCEKYLGDPYDWGNIIDIVKYWFTGKQDIDAHGNAFICSEFAATVIEECSGIDLQKELGRPRHLISPMDLYISKQISWEANNVS